MDSELVTRLRSVISRMARQLNTSATEEGLTPSQASVLSVVAARGPLGLAELTELEGLNPTMLSRIVAKLDAQELIVRVPDPADLRAARVEITARGAAVYRRIKAQRTKVLSECLERLNPSSREQLIEALPALEELAAQLKFAPRVRQ